MAYEQQGSVYDESRSAATLMDEILNDLEAVQTRFDLLNSQSPGFEAGFFGIAQQISYDRLYGIFTAYNGMKAAAGGSWAAFRNALKLARR